MKPLRRFLLALIASVPLSPPVLAAPADVIINVNQVVQTVTVSACDSSPKANNYAMVAGSSIITSVAPPIVSATTVASSTPTVLAPATPPNVDTTHPSNLVPDVSIQLFYTQQSSNGSNALVSIPQMNYMAVNLLQSSYVSTVTCTNSTASITFSNQAAYQVAVSNWTSANPFVLVTYHPECGDAYDNGQHGYVLVSSVSNTQTPALTVVLNIVHIDFEQAVGSNNNITVNVGTYSPTGNNTFSATPGGNGTTGNATSGMNDFDQTLDDSYGPTIAIQSNLTQTLPGSNVTALNATSGNDFPVLNDRRRTLHQHQTRGLFGDIGGYFKSIPKTIASWVGNAKDAVESAAMKTLNALDRFASINKSFSKDLSINQYPSNADTPWGRGYTVYGGQTIKAYCVGCGVNGKITVAATIVFSIANGVKEGSVSADGNMHGVLQLGVVAQAVSVTIPLPTTTFAQLSLSDIVLPGIVAIGPTIKLGAGGSLTVGASGQLLAGVTLDWPTIHAKLDVASISNSGASGFKPNVNPVFSANGQVSANAELFLQASIGFGISILGGKFSKSVDLVEQPGIKASAVLAGSASYQNGQTSGSIASSGSCAGISISANIYNKVFANLAGTQKDIFTWNSDPLTRCIAIGKSSRVMKRQVIDPPPSRLLISGRQTQNVTTTTSTTDSSGTTTGNATYANGTILTDNSGANANYSVVSSADGRFELHWATNGNIYSIASNDTTDAASHVDQDDDDSDIETDDTTTQFSSTGSNLLGDSDGRILHAYVNELSAYNVSRLRLHDPEVMPATAIAVSLRPAKDAAGGPDVMAAEDSAGNIYAPIMCVYGNLFPKIFLAKDPDAGAALLKNLANITGGNVTTCGYVLFAIGD